MAQYDLRHADQFAFVVNAALTDIDRPHLIAT
jgi:hypothetical protein